MRTFLITIAALIAAPAFAAEPAFCEMRLMGDERDDARIGERIAEICAPGDALYFWEFEPTGLANSAGFAARFCDMTETVLRDHDAVSCVYAPKLVREAGAIY